MSLRLAVQNYWECPYNIADRKTPYSRPPVTTPFALHNQTALQRAHAIMAWVWALLDAPVLADGDVFPGRRGVAVA